METPKFAYLPRINQVVLIEESNLENETLVSTDDGEEIWVSTSELEHIYNGEKRDRSPKPYRHPWMDLLPCMQKR